MTEDDYAEVAQRRRSVQRAAATRRWTGSWYTEFVAIDRRGGFPVDRPFRNDMAAFLEPYRMAGTDVEIDQPTFVPLDIALTVCVQPTYFRTDVKAELLRRFGNGRLPDGSPGFFHPDNFTFGQPVFLSRVVAAAMEVEGVSWVDTDHEPGSPNRFGRWGQLPQGGVRGGRHQDGPPRGRPARQRPERARERPPRVPHGGWAVSTAPTSAGRLDSCGCCDSGIHVPTISNPPGHSSIGYRIGTHGSFLARMLAALPGAPYPQDLGDPDRPGRSRR